MTLFIKPLDETEVAELQKIYYTYEAKKEMLEKVLNSTNGSVNEKMVEVYGNSYDSAAVLYREKFLNIISCIPEGIEILHELKTSVNFIKNQLEVLIVCDCDITSEMESAGFRKK